MQDVNNSSNADDVLSLVQGGEIEDTTEPEPEDTRTEREKFMDNATEMGHDLYQANIGWALLVRNGAFARPASRHANNRYRHTTKPKTKRGITLVSDRRLKQAYVVAQLAREMAKDTAA